MNDRKAFSQYPAVSSPDMPPFILFQFANTPLPRFQIHPIFFIADTAVTKSGAIGSYVHWSPTIVTEQIQPVGSTRHFLSCMTSRAISASGLLTFTVMREPCIACASATASSLSSDAPRFSDSIAHRSCCSWQSGR